MTLISLTSSLFLIVKRKIGTWGNNILIVKVFESVQIFCVVWFHMVYQNETFQPFISTLCVLKVSYTSTIICLMAAYDVLK